MAQGPRPLGEQPKRARRYAIIDLLQDSHDILRTDPAMANLLMSQVIERALSLYYAERRVWPPKGKRLLADLRTRDPDLARAIAMLAPEKFDKMIAYVHSPASQRVRTNNHVERTNRRLRYFEKVRYKWRRRRTIVRFIVLALDRWRN